MIVVSLLLILVAVILLVLGLAGGSSGLLISSIVASLLAAVALVVGARQAAAGRRAIGEPLTADPDDVRVATDPETYDFASAARRGPAEPDPADTIIAASPRSSGFAGRSTADTDPGGPLPDPDEPGDVDTLDEPAGRRHDDVADDSGTESDRAAAYAAGQRDTEAALAGPSRAAAGPDVTQRVEPETGPAAGTGRDAGADHAPYSGTGADRTAGRPAQETDPDYDQASSVIGGARAEDDDSWRRVRDAAAEPVPGDDLRHRDPAAASGAVPAGDFGDPDPDDPDDEPLPQRVRPADAVRVARMDAEVVVVDGRPRYHLADCSHLPGRSTEALPVAEAVELGFSPCGLCRPVDRLVAAAARP